MKWIANGIKPLIPTSTISSFDGFPERIAAVLLAEPTLFYMVKIYIIIIHQVINLVTYFVSHIDHIFA